MMTTSRIFCDLEGVLIPEMWPHLAEIFDIEELSITTRDIPDYRGLMRNRLRLLRENGVGIEGICRAIAALKPFEGAIDFLERARSFGHVVIVSDSFSPMNVSLLKILGVGDILCHRFIIGEDGMIAGCAYWNDLAGKHLCLTRYPGRDRPTFAIGDAFNDLSMIRAATSGVLFNPSPATLKAAPDLQATSSYDIVVTLLEETCRQSSGRKENERFSRGRAMGGQATRKQQENPL
ncbi:MAG: bifunctional phosphoserine phosphatase/homoserine phosphotransferase ThrH [Acidiphilium sp.]|nr:bifunctional phosphoserine phosphatase/homoserine phosphotransferase ThrH [Acidiphilium sp.]MDD4937098.1 bifunctional phosphoserine phosphatase/homoserine phosphotransferase ThrH [Acidiphilium sp.]